MCNAPAPRRSGETQYRTRVIACLCLGGRVAAKACCGLPLKPLVLQVAEALPPAALLGRAFAAYPRAGAAVLDAACALAGVAFAFVVMPAGDVLLGRDLQGSAAAVRAP